MVDLWTPPVMKIYDALNGQMRLVGGCVRDFLQNIVPLDTDIATPLIPGSVMKNLEKQRIRSRIVAPRHGVVAAYVGGECFEITTLREDSYGMGREEITFIADYEQDAKRRDFTINAMSADRERIYDYFGGQADLKAGRVRFIGDPAVRIEEDPLRILRYIRFWSLFGKENPDKGILASCAKFCSKLADVSFYRRKKEFHKILMSPRAVPALKIAEEVGALPFVAGKGNLGKLEQILNEKPRASLSERLSCFEHFNRKDKL